jgi:hypothetical protein
VMASTAGTIRLQEEDARITVTMQGRTAALSALPGLRARRPPADLVGRRKEERSRGIANGEERRDAAMPAPAFGYAPR